MAQRVAIGMEARRDRGPGALSRRTELLILCARIGFNPPA